MSYDPPGPTKRFLVTIHDVPEWFDAEHLETAIFNGTVSGYGPLFVPSDIEVEEA